MRYVNGKLKPFFFSVSTKVKLSLISFSIIVKETYFHPKLFKFLKLNLQGFINEMSSFELLGNGRKNIDYEI